MFESRYLPNTGHYTQLAQSCSFDYGGVSNVFHITLHTSNCHCSLYAIFLSLIRYLGCAYQLEARDMHI
jgi:hypothetical protein